MLYALFQALSKTHPFGMNLSALDILKWVELRAVLAVLLSFAVVVLLSPRVIRMLTKMKVGDAPEFHNAAINELMKKKENTPTMGGIIIVAAVAVTSLCLGDLRPETGFYLWAGLIC